MEGFWRAKERDTLERRHFLVLGNGEWMMEHKKEQCNWKAVYLKVEMLDSILNLRSLKYLRDRKENDISAPYPITEFYHQTKKCFLMFKSELIWFDFSLFPHIQYQPQDISSKRQYWRKIVIFKLKVGVHGGSQQWELCVQRVVNDENSKFPMLEGCQSHWQRKVVERRG